MHALLAASCKSPGARSGGMTPLRHRRAPDGRPRSRPDPQRVPRGKPARGDWRPSPDRGWQHDLPEPPPGLLTSSVVVWESWFKAWWAGNWTQDDLPQLKLVIRLWDRVHRGDIKR